jgi:uncharacterized SAM-binding protein YcdF (DUF218 family)
VSWSELAWLKALVLPPGALLLLALGGLAHGSRRGRQLAATAVVLLSLLSLPIVARELMATLEVDARGASGAGAIVVLAADYRSPAPEYGEATVGTMTLIRLRHAARVQRATGLPLLVAGGWTPPEIQPGLAQAMRQVLEREFAVPVRWLEERSRNTFENAREAARILAGEGISRVVVVTHAWHMRRALVAFAAAGLEVSPEPTGAASRETWLWTDLLPHATALAASAFAIHELVGIVWYRVVALLAR